jgi:DNA polymerase III subunit beta
MIINTHLLQQALKAVEASLPTKTTIPVLNSVLMTSDGNRITFATNNLSQSTEAHLESTGDVGKWLLPRKIIEIVAATTVAEIEIDLGDTAIIKGNGKFSLPLDPDTDSFPDGFGGDAYSWFDLDLSILSDIIFAASTEDTRPAFNGILFATDTATASDTYRIAIKNSGWPEGIRTLIPATFIKSALKLGNCKCELAASWVKFSADNISMCSRLLDEKYPDVSGIFPDKAQVEFVLNTQELKGVLTRANLIADGKNRAVTLRTGEQLTVSVDSSVDGRFEETLDIASAECELIFNVKYLLDALQVAPNECKMKLHGGAGPIVLEWQDYYYLMLPIKKAG